MAGLTELKRALGQCVVSQRIIEGGAIGFFYREAPQFEQDSGWRFFSDEDDDEYVANPEHFVLTPLAEVRRHFPNIEPFLQMSEGAWELAEDGGFISAPDWQPNGNTND